LPAASAVLHGGHCGKSPRADHQHRQFQPRPVLGGSGSVSQAWISGHPNIRAFVGYDFMYWTVIIRPGDAIDTTFNPTLFPPVLFAGAARPAPRFDTSDYWVHGANIGVKATF